MIRRERVEGAAYVGDFVDSDVPQVTAALLDGIASAYERWSADGFAAVRDAYESRLALRGRSVCVSGLDGVVRAEGVVAGVDDGGSPAGRLGPGSDACLGGRGHAARLTRHGRLSTVNRSS